jgi:hypothetical protein
LSVSKTETLTPHSPTIVCLGIYQREIKIYVMFAHIGNIYMNADGRPFGNTPELVTTKN